MASRVTAATAIGANVEEYWDTICTNHAIRESGKKTLGRVTFEFSEVLAARRRLAWSFKSTGIEISVRYSTAFADALMKASAMMVGCMPNKNQVRLIIKSHIVIYLLQASSLQHLVNYQPEQRQTLSHRQLQCLAP